MRPGARLASAGVHEPGPRARARPRRVRGSLRPSPDAAARGGPRAARDRRGRHRARLPGTPVGARRARPRVLRRVPADEGGRGLAPRTARDGGEPLVPPRPGAARPTGRATTRRPGPRGTCICCARVGGTGAERLPQPYGTALSARLPVPRAFPETALPAHALRLRLRGRGALAGRTDRRVPRAARAAQGGGDRAEPGRSLRPHTGVDSRQRTDLRVDSTLRLIVSNPVDRLARTIEALLVTAAAQLSVADLADD